MPMALAGLWEGWRGPDGTVLRSFTVLTTTACKALEHLHGRMPVVLGAGAGGPGGELQEQVKELDRLGRELEGPAEAAEVAIWKELVAGQRAR